jgi:hypothetical protein
VSALRRVWAITGRARESALAALGLAVGAGLLTVALFGAVPQVDRIGVTVLLGVAVPVIAVPPRRLPAALCAVASGWFGTYLLMRGVPDVIDPLPPVSNAIGRASYTGTSAVGAQIAAVATAVALILGAATVILLRRRLHLSPSMEGTWRAPTPRAGVWPIRIAVASTVLVALTLVPDIKESFRPFPLLAGAEWDYSNLAAWADLIQRGSTPMDDFFYPYGGQWLYQLVPDGPALRWLAQSALLATAAWSIWRLSEHRPGRVAACLVALGLVGTWADATVWRYLPGLIVATTYAALGPARHPRPVRAHLIFGFACLLAAFLEADLLIYGMTGAAFVFLGELLSGSLLARGRALLRGVAIDLIPVVGAIGALLLIWVAMGSAEGNLRFFLGVRNVSAASMSPAFSPLAHYSLSPADASVILAAPALMLAAGLACAILAHGPEARAASCVLLAGAGVALIFELKSLNRFIGDQVLVFPILTLIWGAILLWNRRSLATTVAIGVFGGGVFVTLQDSSAISNYLERIGESPGRTVRLTELAVERGEIERIAAERFTPRSLAGFPGLDNAADYVRAVGRSADGGVPGFAVLGDAQLVYTVLGQDPPYQVQYYDAAPRAEQRHMVETLRAEHPPFLVRPREAFVQDSIPYEIRDPLVYLYAVRHYVPYRQTPATDILRMRGPEEPLAADYWRSALGSSLRLGFIPSISDGDEAAECSGGPECAPYALVRGDPSSEEPERVKLRLTGRAGPFDVLMRPRQGVTSYAIRLDHLWFWPLLGSRPRLEALTPGWTVRSASVLAGDDLY